MIDLRNVPEVGSEETLARFILSSRHIRHSDNTIRPDAFVPHPYNDLSVTRHREATEEELWAVGRAVASLREKQQLQGRGDVAAMAFVKQGLELHADPVRDEAGRLDNPNHAVVTGWPNEKDRQKLFALEIAAEAKLVHPPP
jgi:hypothetical protein